MKHMMGTREVKEAVKMNSGVRVGGIILRECRNGYAIFDYGEEIARTRKLDTALDWMVEMGYLHETRFRLTAEQRDLLRSKIWEYIGLGVMGGFVTGVALIMTIAWLFIG